MTESHEPARQGEGTKQHQEEQRPGIDHVSQALDNQQRDDAEQDKFSQPVPDNQ
jgi:hypothetical protein